MAVTGAAVNIGSGTRTVSGIIDRRPVGRFQIWTISLCGLVLFADGFDAQTIGFLAPSIAESTGIPIGTFGPIFSASLIGLMIAAMAAGPIADRWGRKWPIILSTLALGVFSIWTAHATSFNQLIVIRFLTGLGLGGAMPNVVALSSEYVPKRLLPVLVAVLFSGLPLGGFVCGLASSAMVPAWGWQSVFYVGGILPVALSLLLIIMLPESAQFLAVRGTDPQKITRLIARIAPDLTEAGSGFSLPEPELARTGVPVKYLFTEGRAPGTVLLWIPNFMNLLLMYVIVNWLPALLRESGMSVSAGVTATAFYSLGGILGTLLQGLLIRGFGPYMTLLAEFGLSGLFIASLSLAANSFPLVAALAFVLGFLVTGAQAGLNVLAARFYPTSIRSTGVGWALGIGRIGSILGPLLAGILLSTGWEPWQVLLSGAVPAFCALLSILLGNRLRVRTNPYSPE